MLGNCKRSRMLVGSASLTIVLLAAIAGPGLAGLASAAEPVAGSVGSQKAPTPTPAPAPSEEAAEPAVLDGERICVRVSTDPPAVGVYEECGSGGSGTGSVYLDDQRVLVLPSTG